jgi:transcriptional regulator with XRE-family HTH domain
MSDKGFIQLTQAFAKNLKKIRLKADLTQEEMLSKGFNVRHYQRLESGKSAPTLYTIYRLSKIFKVRVTDFFV